MVNSLLLAIAAIALMEYEPNSQNKTAIVLLYRVFLVVALILGIGGIASILKL